MFQSWFVELVSLLSNICVGVSAIVVAGMSVYGIRQWQRELKGRSKFEIARKMTLLAFQFQDELRTARSPATFVGESVERTKGDDETPGERNIRDEHFARSMRLRPLQETMVKLREASWEAEALLIEGADKLIQPFEEAYRGLSISITFFFNIQLEMQKASDKYVIPPALLDNHHKTIYGSGDADEISNAVDIAVVKLTTQMKKCVQ